MSSKFLQEVIYLTQLVQAAKYYSFRVLCHHGKNPRLHLLFFPEAFVGLLVAALMPLKHYRVD